MENNKKRAPADPEAGTHKNKRRIIETGPLVAPSLQPNLSASSSRSTPQPLQVPVLTNQQPCGSSGVWLEHQPVQRRMQTPAPTPAQGTADAPGGLEIRSNLKKHADLLVDLTAPNQLDKRDENVLQPAPGHVLPKKPTWISEDTAGSGSAIETRDSISVSNASGSNEKDDTSSSDDEPLAQKRPSQTRQPIFVPGASGGITQRGSLPGQGSRAVSPRLDSDPARAALWACVEPFITGKESAEQYRQVLSTDEKRAFDQVMKLDKQRDPDRVWTTHIFEFKRASRFTKVITVLIRAVGIQFCCTRCLNSPDRQRHVFCTILPAEATQLHYLHQLVGNKCCYCFLHKYTEAGCFARDDSTMADPDMSGLCPDGPAATDPTTARESNDSEQRASSGEAPTARPPDDDVIQTTSTSKMLVAPTLLVVRGLKAARESLRGNSAQPSYGDDDLKDLARTISDASYERDPGDRYFFKHMRWLSESFAKNCALLVSLQTDALDIHTLVGMTVDELREWTLPSGSETTRHRVGEGGMTTQGMSTRADHAAREPRSQTMEMTTTFAAPSDVPLAAPASRSSVSSFASQPNNIVATEAREAFTAAQHLSPRDQDTLSSYALPSDIQRRICSVAAAFQCLPEEEQEDARQEILRMLEFIL